MAKEVKVSAELWNALSAVEQAKIEGIMRGAALLKSDSVIVADSTISAADANAKAESAKEGHAEILGDDKQACYALCTAGFWPRQTPVLAWGRLLAHA